MQLQLPLFSKATKFISSCLGVYEQEGLVQYIINGLPAYAHDVNDYKEFRYITSNFIERGLCSKAEVCRCFGVSIDSVTSWHKKYIKEGRAGVFGADGRGGTAHRIVGEKRELIQKKLDKGQSVNSIAKEEGIGESAIRYAVKAGYLKKKSVR